jgi:hypothetical protein
MCRLAFNSDVNVAFFFNYFWKLLHVPQPYNPMYSVHELQIVILK